MADPSNDRRRFAEAAWSEGHEGRFRSMEQVAWKLQHEGGSEATAWGHALRALRWHAEPDMGRLCTLEELEPIAISSEAEHAAVLAASQAAKAFALRFDRPALARVSAWIAPRVERITGEAAAWALVALGLDHVASARWEDAERCASDACSRATAASASAALLDATALLALSVAPRDLGEATRIARRGSRMARTEGLPQSEYLANVVLARMRRLEGRPHHATRILGALARVASPEWRPWIAWELLLAGGLESSRSIALDGDGSARAAVGSFRDALFAAKEGDRARFDASVARARSGTGAFEPFAGDLTSATSRSRPARSRRGSRATSTEHRRCCAASRPTSKRSPPTRRPRPS
jgi:hypothetical protein